MNKHKKFHILSMPKKGFSLLLVFFDLLGFDPRVVMRGEEVGCCVSVVI